jgi:hypothetical protein
MVAQRKASRANSNDRRLWLEGSPFHRERLGRVQNGGKRNHESSASTFVDDMNAILYNKSIVRRATSAEKFVA